MGKKFSSWLAVQLEDEEIAVPEFGEREYKALP
jgi:hypothetical protein